MSAQFDVVTFAVPTNRNFTVREAAGGVTKSASFTVLALQVSSLVIVPPAGFGPFQAQGTVTLNLPAPANTAVSLTSSNPNVVRFGTLGNAQSTGTIQIQQNQSPGTFQVVASSVTQTTTVTVTVRLNNGNTRSISMTVRAL